MEKKSESEIPFPTSLAKIFLVSIYDIVFDFIMITELKVSTYQDKFKHATCMLEQLQ
jgi:hypothetical protein